MNEPNDYVSKRFVDGNNKYVAKAVVDGYVTFACKSCELKVAGTSRG